MMSEEDRKGSNGKDSTTHGHVGSISMISIGNDKPEGEEVMEESYISSVYSNVTSVIKNSFTGPTLQHDENYNHERGEGENDATHYSYFHEAADHHNIHNEYVSSSVVMMEGAQQFDNDIIVNVNTQDFESTPCGVHLDALYRKTNTLLVGVVICIFLAKVYPPLGAVYLFPQITSTWIAVIIIILISGLGLKTEELTKASQRVWFNLFVQSYNFLFISYVVHGISFLLVKFQVITQALGDGLTITSCLPMTINLVTVLTKSSDGDEAAAIFNTAFGNMIGVFLSPTIILGYLGVQGELDVMEVFLKLALRVLLPIFIGQVLQKTSKRVVNFVEKYKSKLQKVQEACLIFIVYTVFCRTFSDPEQCATISQICKMIVIEFVLLVVFNGVAWTLLGILYANEPRLRVMGLFGCTHKTIAMGIPLINSVYESSPNLGLYTLPILIWHPTQLIIGTFLAPRLSKFISQKEEQRISGYNTGFLT